MTPFKISRRAAATLRLYQGILGLDGEAEVLPVSFPPSASCPPLRMLVARIEIPMEDQKSLWFFGTLGDSLAELGAAVGHEHNFVGIYECGSDEFPAFVAACRHFDLTHETLDVDHTFPLQTGSQLDARGYTHGLVLSADLYSGVIPAFVGSTDVNVLGCPTRILVVLPLTRGEWCLKLAHGTAALLDAWLSANRDPFVVLPVRA